MLRRVGLTQDNLGSRPARSAEGLFDKRFEEDPLRRDSWINRVVQSDEGFERGEKGVREQG